MWWRKWDEDKVCRKVEKTPSIWNVINWTYFPYFYHFIKEIILITFKDFFNKILTNRTWFFFSPYGTQLMSFYTSGGLNLTFKTYFKVKLWFQSKLRGRITIYQRFKNIKKHFLLPHVSTNNKLAKLQIQLSLITKFQIGNINIKIIFPNSEFPNPKSQLP